MDLRITNSSKDYGMQAYKISLYDFGCKEYHPFIITNKWDRIFIDLCDETPKGIIRQLLQLSVVKPIFDRSNITAKVMQLLCECFPDEAPKLRAAYIKDKEAFNNLINEICPEV